jgi:2-deoxy-D-gluconate 3-dehydrogenase
VRLWEYLFIATHGTGWDETRKLIETEGRRAEFFKADLSVKENITKIVKNV